MATTHESLHRLQQAWKYADGEARRSFLLEIYRAQAGPGAGEGTIEMTSQVNAGDGSPAVLLRWEERQVTMTPDEAKRHALALLEVATGAEADAFLVSFFQTTVGLPRPQAVQVLQDFRRWREEMARRLAAEDR